MRVVTGTSLPVQISAERPSITTTVAASRSLEPPLPALARTRTPSGPDHPADAHVAGVDPAVDARGRARSSASRVEVSDSTRYWRTAWSSSRSAASACAIACRLARSRISLPECGSATAEPCAREQRLDQRRELLGRPAARHVDLERAGGRGREREARAARPRSRAADLTPLPSPLRCGAHAVGWRLARPRIDSPPDPRPNRREIRETMASKVRPLHNRIIVQRIKEEEKTAGGIIIPDTAKEKPTEGKVIAAGPGRRDDKGHLVAMDVKKGDRVLFGKYGGQRGHARRRGARDRLRGRRPRDPGVAHGQQGTSLRRSRTALAAARRRHPGGRGQGHDGTARPQRADREELGRADLDQGRRHGREGDQRPTCSR